MGETSTSFGTTCQCSDSVKLGINASLPYALAGFRVKLVHLLGQLVSVVTVWDGGGWGVGGASCTMLHLGAELELTWEGLFVFQ